LSPLILKILALVQPTLRGLTAYQEPFWRGKDIAFVKPARATIFKDHRSRCFRSGG
jgi:hypothetical protein